MARLLLVLATAALQQPLNLSHNALAICTGKTSDLFVVDVDIIHSQIGQNAHVILPACESNEMNLTSMNGERRLRLSERYMDPYGNSRPDCLIAAGIAQHMERVLREMGEGAFSTAAPPGARRPPDPRTMAARSLAPLSFWL